MLIPFRFRGVPAYAYDGDGRFQRTRMVGREKRRWRKGQVREFLRLAEDRGAEPKDEPLLPEPDDGADWWDWDDELEWSFMERDYPNVWEDTVLLKLGVDYQPAL